MVLANFLRLLHFGFIGSSSGVGVPLRDICPNQILAIGGALPLEVSGMFPQYLYYVK